MTLATRDFHKLFTFARSTAGLYFDRQGLFSEAAPGAPGYEWDPVSGAPLGISIEPSRVNLIPNSNDFSVWPGNGNFQFDTQPNGAPDGGSYQRITKLNPAILTEGVTLQNTPYAVEIWVKNPQGFTGEWAFILYNGTTSSIIRTIASVNGSTGIVSPSASTGKVVKIGDWYRIRDVIRKSESSGWSDGDQGRFYAHSGGTTEVGGSLDIWHYQVEAGEYTTSPIRSDGGATARSRDRLYLNVTGAQFPEGQGTIIYEGTRSPEEFGVADWLYEVHDSSRALRIFQRDYSPNKIQSIYDWGNAQSAIQAGESHGSIPFRSVISFKAGEVMHFASLGQYWGQAPLSPNEAAPSVISLGQDGAGNWAGKKHIRRFQVRTDFISDPQTLADMSAL